MLLQTLIAKPSVSNSYRCAHVGLPTAEALVAYVSLNVYGLWPKQSWITPYVVHGASLGKSHLTRHVEPNLATQTLPGAWNRVAGC